MLSILCSREHKSSNEPIWILGHVGIPGPLWIPRPIGYVRVVVGNVRDLLRVVREGMMGDNGIVTVVFSFEGPMTVVRPHGL